MSCEVNEKKGCEFTISKIKNFEILKLQKYYIAFFRIEWYVEIR